MIDTAGTLVEAAKSLKQNGAQKIYSFATHGVFSGPAHERIDACEELDGVIVTDTIPLCENMKKVEKVHVLTVEISGEQNLYSLYLDVHLIN